LGDINRETAFEIDLIPYFLLPSLKLLMETCQGQASMSGSLSHYDSSFVSVKMW